MQKITTACAKHACGKMIDQGRVAKAYLSMGTGCGNLPQVAAEAAKHLEEHQLLAEQRSEVSTRGTSDRSTLSASESCATDILSAMPTEVQALMMLVQAAAGPSMLRLWAKPYLDERYTASANKLVSPSQRLPHANETLRHADGSPTDADAVELVLCEKAGKQTEARTREQTILRSSASADDVDASWWVAFCCIPAPHFASTIVIPTQLANMVLSSLFP